MTDYTLIQLRFNVQLRKRLYNIPISKVLHQEFNSNVSNVIYVYRSIPNVTIHYRREKKNTLTIIIIAAIFRDNYMAYPALRAFQSTIF